MKTENRPFPWRGKVTNWITASLLLIATPALAQNIRPLTNDFVVLGESPDPDHIPLYTPSILSLGGGHLVAAYEYGGKQRRDPYTFILISEDGGKTWSKTGETSITHGRLFQAGKSLYYLGQKGDLRIIRSDDNGKTWSAISELSHNQSWHASACNVWHAKGNIYLVMERVVESHIKGWNCGELAPILMRAPENADLTKRESWKFASELPFYNTIPGYKENNLDLEYFGVPFFTQNYPSPNVLAPKRPMAPVGWLEGNVVQITDPNHFWYDPEGNTFHLFMRAHTGGTGYAALAKVTEKPDGTMETILETAPSGKKMLFLPFPGGQMRFHIVYDDKTKLFWMLGSQATDSMTRPGRLPAERFDLPNNERHRLVLHFSRNMVDWCFAGVVAIGQSPKQSRHYAAMDINGDDLIILSRSGDERAQTAHNGNLITFHRVKNFRELVY